MPESKKYWYIQLNVNFFEDDRIDWLCEQQNGYAYVVLYLKLCLKTANNNGILTRQIGDMIIPYNVDKIAEITHINVDIVRVALELYKKIGLVYETDAECNFMRLPEVPGMVGCVTQAALDKRKQRERKQLGEGQSQDDVPDNVQDNVQQELRDKSKEIRVNKQETQQEKEGEKGRKRPPAHFVPPTVEAECNFMRLPEVPGMVGCVTQAALDKRKQRERKQLGEGQSQDDVPDNVQDNVQQELRDKSKEIRVNKQETQQEKEGEKGRKRPPAHFVPPTVEEVRAYCQERKNNVDPERFHDYYSANGWVQGKGKPIKDWKAAVRTWERNGNGNAGSGQRTQKAPPKSMQPGDNYQPTSDRIQEQSDWLDQFLAEQREQEEQERYES